MDPISAAIIAAVTAGVTSGVGDVGKEAIVDAYNGLKNWIVKKLGDAKAIDALETHPDSEPNRARLAEALAAEDADRDPEINRLARQLIQTLQETKAGRQASKYHIEAAGAQVGVIGNGACIEGGQSQVNASDKSDPAGPPDDDRTAQYYVLHLSDLHFGTQKDAHRWAGQLADDLKLELGCSRLDAMIITGDVANVAVQEEYDAAESFIKRVCEEFGIPAANLAMVPGNHDLNWDLSEDGYTPVKRKKYQGKLEEGSYIEESDALIQIRDDKAYEERFAPFSVFFEKVMGRPYPLSHDQQGMIHHFKDLDLLILGLNSAWLVDHHFKSRAAVCPDALNTALDTIRQNPDYAPCLKFAIWHHPLVSPFEDRITGHGFMERLAQSGFCVCFHGHLHKTETGLFRYDLSPGGRQIEIVGAGTFGAPTKDWSPGYPLQYNLLEISQKQMTVRTRCRTEINGAWKPHAIWSQGPGKDPLSWYIIDLGQGSSKPHGRQNKPAPPSTKKKTTPTADHGLEPAINAYGQKAQALYENLPLMGFRTKLRVPIRI